MFSSSSSSTMKWLASVVLLLFLEVLASEGSSGGKGRGRGHWELLLNNSGVVAMHMALTHRNTVVIFDQTRAGPSSYCLPRRAGCRHCNSSSPSCWAHSTEYDLSSGRTRPLVLETDTWCSSGSFLSDGTLLQTGGHGDGDRKVRRLHHCRNHDCDWVESRSPLAHSRWYASDQLLPEKDDKVIVVGGRATYTYEFVPKSSHHKGSFELPFLHQTRTKKEGGNNLYPFLHLSSDGNLFVFANRDSILLDYKHHRVVKTFPSMPGGGSRSYPSTASSVILPLDHADGFQKVEVMICGGASAGAYRAAKRGRFLRALRSCGRMVITEEEPEWAMEDMPGARVISDMLLLPTGDVLLINGAKRGCAGWGMARRPARRPYLYKPSRRADRRFSILSSSAIPRMYHSSAIVLPDGRVLVAGSNTNSRYTFSGVRYPTELRVEAFSPPYMAESFSSRRAVNLSLNLNPKDGTGGAASPSRNLRNREVGIKYGEEFGVGFELPGRAVLGEVGFHAYAPPFATHSVSMNQRLMKLRWSRIFGEKKGGWVHAVVVAPPSPEVAPSGYYLLTVVNRGVPSKGIWVRFVHG